MKRINSTGILSGLLSGGLLLIGCAGDDVATPQDTDTSGTSDGGMTTMTMTTMTTMTTMADETTVGVDPDSTSEDTTPMEESADDTGSSSSDGGFVAVPVDMFMEITNISGDAVTFTPISPGVWLNHEVGAELLFTEDEPDAGAGLESLAEDGNPVALLAAIADNAGHLLSGAFTDPVDGAGPAPIFPGESYRVEFTAEPQSRLSAAMMLVGSNDQVIATGDPGVGLFAGNGQPLGLRDVTNTFKVWDAGTEVNQAPSQGPWQALFSEGAANLGAPEAGGVFRHNDSTRAIPLPIDLIEVDVEQGDGEKVPADTYTITLTNTSNVRGTLPTPFSGLFWMTHDDTVSMFDAGAAASAGIEAIAEDGDTSVLAAAHVAGAGGVGVAGEIAGPIAPGDAISFEVATTTATPWLTFATMIVESNDAFLAPPQASIRLYDAEDDSPRDNSEIREDIERLLTVWDAGTEANETPGAGPNQVSRQANPDTGAADADATVRIYQDEGSDLDGPSLGGMLTVTIVNDLGNPGEFTVRLQNTSGTTGYNAVFTPAFHMLHDDTVLMHETGTEASLGLESLAEDGDPTTIIDEWTGDAGVLLAAANADPIESNGTPVGTPGPIEPGQYYEFNVTPDATNRFFSFAQMVVPSNDTFAAFGSGGIALLNAAGAARSNEAIAADIAADLDAWDAGTEANQCGAAGRDQAPRQAAPNTGEGNGSGLVRRHRDAAGNVVIWSAPQAEQVVRITVGPVRK